MKSRPLASTSTRTTASSTCKTASPSSTPSFKCVAVWLESMSLTFGAQSQVNYVSKRGEVQSLELTESERREIEALSRRPNIADLIIDSMGVPSSVDLPSLN